MERTSTLQIIKVSSCAPRNQTKRLIRRVEAHMYDTQPTGFAAGSACPASHPVRVPQLAYETLWVCILNRRHCVTVYLQLYRTPPSSKTCGRRMGPTPSSSAMETKMDTLTARTLITCLAGRVSQALSLLKTLSWV
jgi:hypothetical protein